MRGPAAAPGKRRPALPAALLAVLLAGAACGVPVPREPQGRGPGGGAAGQVAGRVLYWAALDLEPGPVAPYALDAGGVPLTAAPGDSGTWLRRLVHAGLMAAGPAGTLVPDLAAEHRTGAGGLEHRFRLREGAAYWDGGAVAGGDVLAAWRHYLALHPAAGGLVESLRWDDAAGEAVLVLAQPAPWLVRALSLVPVVPPDRHVGAGPFRAAAGPGDRWVLERVPRASGGPEAVPSRIEAAPVDAAHLPALLERGVDLISGLTGDRVEALRPVWEAGGYRAVAVPRGWRLAALMNPLRPPLDDPQVRRALAAALDRGAAARALGDARPVAAGAGAPDLEQALRQAGYAPGPQGWSRPHGEPWEIRLVVPDGLWAELPAGAAAGAAGALAAGLERAGLAVRVEILDPDAFLGRVYEYRAFDLAILPVALDETGAPADPGTLLDVGAVPPLPGTGGDHEMLAWLADPVVWALERLDAADFQLDETAGLVRSGATSSRKDTGEVEERPDA